MAAERKKRVFKMSLEASDLLDHVYEDCRDNRTTRLRLGMACFQLGLIDDPNALADAPMGGRAGIMYFALMMLEGVLSSRVVFKSLAQDTCDLVCLAVVMRKLTGAKTPEKMLSVEEFRAVLFEAVKRLDTQSTEWNADDNHLWKDVMTLLTAERDGRTHGSKSDKIH